MLLRPIGIGLGLAGSEPLPSHPLMSGRIVKTNARCDL
jgi:hypothetical protein